MNEGVPGREAVLESVLRHLSRSETPMRYVLVQRLRRMLYSFSDTQYEGFMRELARFDPSKIEPARKKAFLAALDEMDESGMARKIAENSFESVELLQTAKEILLGVKAQ